MGCTYLLSRVGVTGTETAANMPVEKVLAKLKEDDAPKYYGLEFQSQNKSNRQ